MEHKKYWCPSHPEIQSNTYGDICTKCGTMKLIPNPNYISEDGKKMKIIKPKRPLKDFLPIIIIFSLIAIFTTLMTVFVHTELEFGMRMMMGSFFAVFGFFKIINLKAFADAYSTYDIVAMKSRTYAFVYPFFEILIAILYLSNNGGIYRDVFTFLLMAVSTIGVVKKLRAKEEIPCACLGMVFKLPMTWITLTEDLLMMVEAFIMIILAI